MPHNDRRRACAVSLARGICAERGADYEKTVEGLKYE